MIRFRFPFMRTVRNFQVKKARTRNVENPGVACTAGVSVKTGDASRRDQSILKAEFKLGFRNHLAVHQAACRRLADVSAHLGQFRFNDERIAGNHDAAEFNLVRTHEVAELAGIAGLAQHDDGGYLGHGFHLENARHDRMAREVALEKEFIHGQVLQSPALRFSFKTDNAVHHQEGIAVRQQFADTVYIHYRFTVAVVTWCLYFVQADFFPHLTGKFIVYGVSRTSSMIRPLIGFPIRARSPMTSSSLWRAHSLGQTNGL